MRALILLPLLSFALAAHDNSLPTVIQRVRIYPNQAWTTREATWTFPAPGSQRLRFANLPSGLSLDEIRVSVSGIANLRLGNVAVTQERTPYLPDAQTKVLQAEADKLLKEIADLGLRKDSITQAKNALLALRPESGPADAMALLDLRGSLELARAIQARVDELQTQGLGIAKEEEATRARWTSLQESLAKREAEGSRQCSVVWVELEASSQGEARIQLNVRTNGARWRPGFEVRLGEKSLELLCYASVSQASGEDWRSVGMEISNAEPGRVLRIPSPPPPVQILYEAPGVVLAGRIEGRVTDRAGRPLAGVTIEASSEPLKVRRTIVSDSNGAFRLLLLPPGEYFIRASKSGHPTTHASARVMAGQATALGLQLLPTMAAATVEVVAQSSSVDSTYTTSGVNVSQTALSNALESTPAHYEDSGDLSRAWILEGKRDLPSDALSRRVLLARHSLDPELRYKALPRGSTEVFLVATLPPLSGFPWFPGTPTTVFRNGEQLGQVGLPRPQSGAGTLFSFGPVAGLRTQRTRLEATVSTGKSGKGREWTLRERILLVNDLDRDVEVEVQEPALRSASDRIKIESLPESTPGEEKGGFLVWRIKVPAHGQSRIEEAWRILGPGTGSVPELTALGLPTSD